MAAIPAATARVLQLIRVSIGAAYNNAAIVPRENLQQISPIASHLRAEKSSPQDAGVK
jgi:hypothetical protein